MSVPLPLMTSRKVLVTIRPRRRTTRSPNLTLRRASTAPKPSSTISRMRLRLPRWRPPPLRYLLLLSRKKLRLTPPKLTRLRPRLTRPGLTLPRLTLPRLTRLRLLQPRRRPRPSRRLKWHRRSQKLLRRAPLLLTRLKSRNLHLRKRVSRTLLKQSRSQRLPLPESLRLLPLPSKHPQLRRRLSLTHQRLPLSRLHPLRRNPRPIHLLRLRRSRNLMPQLPPRKMPRLTHQRLTHRRLPLLRLHQPRRNSRPIHLLKLRNPLQLHLLSLKPPLPLRMLKLIHQKLPLKRNLLRLPLPSL